MSDFFITRRGGGGGGSAAVYAVIAASYPEGSLCTCTDGAVTLTATDRSGSYIFLLSTPGTWTISCTDGDKTASKTMTITEQYQVENVALLYRLMVFEEGSGFVNGFSWAKNSGGTVNVTNASIATTSHKSYGMIVSPAVDLTEYTSLRAEIIFTKSGVTDEGYHIAVVPKTNTVNNPTGNKYAEAGIATASASRQIQYIDLTNVNVEALIGIGTYQTNLTIFNLWYE